MESDRDAQSGASPPGRDTIPRRQGTDPLRSPSRSNGSGSSSRWSRARLPTTWPAPSDYEAGSTAGSAAEPGGHRRPPRDAALQLHGDRRFPRAADAPSLSLPLPIADFTGFPEGEREAQASRQAVQEARRPFDLTQAPLLRARLLRLGTEDHILVIACTTSWPTSGLQGVLFRELGALYEAHCAGSPRHDVRRAHPIRRLCRVAAAMAPGRAVGARAELLARTAPRRTSSVRAADRPPPLTSADLPRGEGRAWSCLGP